MRGGRGSRGGGRGKGDDSRCSAITTRSGKNRSGELTGGTTGEDEFNGIGDGNSGEPIDKVSE